MDFGNSAEKVVLHAVIRPIAVFRQANVMIMPSSMLPKAPK